MTEDADDAARWWRAYQLAAADREDERRRAEAGDDQARERLTLGTQRRSDVES